MASETLDPATLLSSLDEAGAQLQELLLSLDDKEINTVPYEDSWTAGMLYRHITKVISGMVGALQLPSKPAGRSTDERVAELKKTFLDFSTKMKSPDMALPEDEVYQKQDTLDKLQAAFKNFREVAGNQDAGGLVSVPPLGDITKLELLHFTLYHTQRHLHQMQKIVNALHATQTPAGRQEQS